MTFTRPDPTRPPAPAPSQAKILRRLFLTLFLRGRGARGLDRSKAPRSVGRKLAITLVFYAAFGCYALVFLRQSVFTLSAYLHAMTFVFLGLFVSSSAGEVLFNKEEGEILLHRPISPAILLWSKIRVLVEISLWLAFAINLAGLIGGIFVPDGGWRFPLAHILSTTLEAFFCCGCVVLVYQLCLRWFGRERLDNIMTLAQILAAIAMIMSGQILPQIAVPGRQILAITHLPRWLALLPPAWFAGFDDALAGSAGPFSWLLLVLALAFTSLVLWLAFGKLSRSYQSGLEAMSESPAPRAPRRGSGSAVQLLLKLPPWRWWCRDPVTRASFLLIAAYLTRDRDVKLRLYPGLAPVAIMPAVLLLNSSRNPTVGSSSFAIAFLGCFLGLIPVLALELLRFSQQWQASDIFRVAPLPGPAALCDGARYAVLTLLTVPLGIACLAITCILLRQTPQVILLLIPGLIALPVYGLIPARLGLVPLSKPTEEANAAGRGLKLLGVILVSMAIAGMSVAAWSMGWFWPFVAAEAVVAALAYVTIRLSLKHLRWDAGE